MSLLADFERDCREADVQPQDAVRAGGVHASLWWKWKRGLVSPSLKNYERACAGLAKLKANKRALGRMAAEAVASR